MEAAWHTTAKPGAATDRRTSISMPEEIGRELHDKEAKSHSWHDRPAAGDEAQDEERSAART
jgi:hypothetical protein